MNNGTESQPIRNKVTHLAVSRRRAIRAGALAALGAGLWPPIAHAADEGAQSGQPVLRDDGQYQNGGYWATPLAWFMSTLMRADAILAAQVFCEAVDNFRARDDINEWINDNNPKKPFGARAYCASASMPLVGVRCLRAFLKQSGKQLPPELSRRLDAAEAWLKPQAERILRAAAGMAKNGVRIFRPCASGNYGAFWVRDFSYQVEGCPAVFSREEIRAGYLFLAAGQRADGCMPDRVNVTGQPVYSPGPDTRQFTRNGSVDQSPFMVILCHQYWKLYGDLEPFRNTADALEKAMRFTPRNPDNGLVRIDDPKEFGPYSFFDVQPLTGDQQFDSVLFWDASLRLAEMLEAAGEVARAQTWRHEAERVKRALPTLWDEQVGLFVAASKSWRQPSVWGSVFAAHVGIATSEQCDRIAGWCRDNYHLIVQHGQIRQLPRGTFWGRPVPEYIRPG